MQNKYDIEQFYKNESGRIISVLVNRFGVNRFELVEDSIQDAMIDAIRIWEVKGLPTKPSSWIYKVAKNNILNSIKKENLNLQYSNIINKNLYDDLDDDYSFSLIPEQEIDDDQLRMIFMCCHPSITFDSQVALTLKTLCGFSISEIANAFVTTNDNINKRLVRSRKKIKSHIMSFNIPIGDELKRRLNVVLSCLYFLFNESYKASTGTRVIKNCLFEEAIRLTELVVNHPLFKGYTEPLALLALMQLNGSRFPARQTTSGQVISLDIQDRSEWDLELMEKGYQNLLKSMADNSITKYHILASISSFYCSAKNYESTDWESILELYDKLLLIDNSAIVLLNRAIVVSKVYSPQRALEEIDIIEKSEQLVNYSPFYLTKAELLQKSNINNNIDEYFTKAIELTNIKAEKEYIRKRMEETFQN